MGSKDYIVDGDFIFAQIDDDTFYFYHKDGKRVDSYSHLVLGMRQDYIKYKLETDPNTKLFYGKNARLDLSKDKTTYRLVMYEYGKPDPIEEMRKKEKGPINKIKRLLIKNDSFKQNH